MVELGAACLIAAPVACLYAIVAAILGARRADRRLVDSSRRAIYALCALLTVCVVVLEAAFLRTDLSVALVAEHSSTTTPTGYKLTAMWSSQGGSLLLWAWVLSIASSGVLYLTRNRHREIVPWATAVLAAVGLFFTLLMLLANDVNPFERLDPAPAEGVGLTPLLRHPMMAIHPVMLYSGYVLWSIPFAFAIGALISRRLDSAWIRSTRRFALVAWTFLGIGILLGSRWSYSELGWGGYWGWDAVENASLMPWLVGTAFLHSVMVQEKRGMLKVWNVSMIVATFALALLGTFLVRSGILESIHAFGASTVGTPLLVLIAVVIAGSAALVVSRLDDLRSERRIESLASREAVFLVNNLLLVGLAVVIFWGTFFPLISEAFTGEKSSLGSPWFDRYTAPLAIVLVLFTGIGPLLAWRRVSAGALWRLLRAPLAVAVAATVAVAVFTDALDHPPALVLFAFAFFALAALAAEFWRGASAQRALSGGGYLSGLRTVVARNRRRYGGYIVHAGIAILFIAVAASSSFQTSEDLRMMPGDSAQVGDYTVTYDRPTESIDAKEQKLTFGAVLDVDRDGRQFATLYPARAYYSSTTGDPTIRGFFDGEATSEVGRKTQVGGDLWTAMRPDLAPLDDVIAGVDRRLQARLPDVGPEGPSPAQVEAMRDYTDRQGQAIGAIAALYLDNPLPVDFRVNVNPFVIWIWIGGAIAVAGALIAVWPAPEARRRRVSDVYAARLARDLGRAEI
jgi:cytochrome c-type biogenesis protein CcmF